MECNKDEATRAKIIAEQKLTEKDFYGAKKFTLKAQALYPGLEGISQLLMILDVYITAENKINGEVDWYGILGVSPSADDETVKKQYKKLALMLHPDKNKCVGADGAFKLVSQAWSLLSDVAKKLEYQRRISKGYEHRVLNKSGGESATPNAKGFHDFQNRATSNEKRQNIAAQVHPTTVHPPSHPTTDSFWTTCPRCKMQYEFLRSYINRKLVCPSCREAFKAFETARPPNFSKTFAPRRPGDRNLFNHSNVQQGPLTKATGVGTTESPASVAAKSARVVQRANPSTKAAGVGTTASPDSVAAKSASVVQRENPFTKAAGVGTAASPASVAAKSATIVQRVNPFTKTADVGTTASPASVAAKSASVVQRANPFTKTAGVGTAASPASVAATVASIVQLANPFTKTAGVDTTTSPASVDAKAASIVKRANPFTKTAGVDTTASPAYVDAKTARVAQRANPFTKTVGVGTTASPASMAAKSASVVQRANPFTKTADVGTMVSPASVAAKSASVVQQANPFTKTAGVGTTASPDSMAAKIASVVQPANPFTIAASVGTTALPTSVDAKAASVTQQANSFTKTAGVGTTASRASVTAKAASAVQRANEKLKRKRDVSDAADDREGLLKKGKVDGGINGPRHKTARQMGMRDGGNGRRRLFGLRKGGLNTDGATVFSGVNDKLKSMRELTPLEIRNMLMKKAQTDISKKLKEWSSEAITRPVASKKEKVKESKNEKEKHSVEGGNHKQKGNGVSSSAVEGDIASKYFTNTSADDGEKDIAPMSMNVPDPDFHDFDQDRTERSFAGNQVWAAYDDDDGMPRFYAMIHKVISFKPFKMRISWLNSKTNSEFGAIGWIGSGFYKTCGEFRMGKHKFTGSLNSFSHQVKWAKGPRGTVCIYPKKGDVWALYRNWSVDWNVHTPDEVIHKYDMVEVLEDYNEDQGVSVAPLIKVAGFRTVFLAHADPEKVRQIPKEEMFRFSHQVPNYLLTGREAQNVTKGCHELDPAATPMELLQVITEANGATVENEEKAETMMLHSSAEIKVDEIVTRATEANDEEEAIGAETKDG
ncbi:uncharacterized protein LOC127796168 [Diospyros lotus]|uniref:uncharacterized protein LOC127796168 n=1 Tax=Diospyros lotus TaxID=55363 RepID=UPI0022573AA7|nr:uncharacterized protein LOC127796168 [Diospyros lotus]